MPPLRIALCITELDVGGAERCLTELALRVDRTRFAPVVYCLAGRPGRADATFLPTLLDAGVEVHCLGGGGIWQFPMVLRRLRRLLSEQSPHVVQTFLFHANVLGRIAAHVAGVENVVSGIRVAERAAGWHLWLDRMTQRWARRYVCVSQAVADFSIAKGGLPPEKLVVIPNGIDLEKYSAARPADLRSLGVASGRRAVVFVGRLESQKGVKWLVETSPRWLDRAADCDLLVVGEGPLRRTLETTARTLNVTDRIHFVGWRPDTPAILAAADLLVLPSAWEGMPNVVLEAMASRRPVVATEAEGVLELLGPNAPEQTARYLDTVAWTERIVGFLRDPVRAALVGGENRRRAEEHFSISKTVQAYEALWASF